MIKAHKQHPERSVKSSLGIQALISSEIESLVQVNQHGTVWLTQSENYS